MTALPGFCLNKKQKIHDVLGIYYVPLQMKKRVVIINARNVINFLFFI